MVLSITTTTPRASATASSSPKASSPGPTRAPTRGSTSRCGSCSTSTTARSPRSVDLYDELGLSGDVLDLCASWVSHFHTPPARLVVLGMNAAELEHNPQASERVVHDLNADPTLPFPDASFDAATCCVSVDYLTQPLQVFDEVARVLRPGGVFVCTFSNRCFPTKAIRGWLASDDAGHVAIVEEYFRRSRGWDEPVAERRTPLHHHGDPLYAVWARREDG